METRQIVRQAERQNASPDSSAASAELTQIQASCQRLADAADAEIERALNGGVGAEEFLESTRQLRGGQ